MSVQSTIQGEPVAVPAAILGFATAVLAMLVGLEVLDEQVSALILGVVAAAIPLVGVFYQRARVTPVRPEPEVLPGYDSDESYDPFDQQLTAADPVQLQELADRMAEVAAISDPDLRLAAAERLAAKLQD